MNILEQMRDAYRQAELSPDMSNQNGAVLYKPNLGMSVGNGYNHFNSIEAVFERTEKLMRITHAEEAAVHSAWGNIGPLWMICPWACCPDCARDIINCRAPITKLFVHKERMILTPERWTELVEYGLNMVRESGIEVLYINGPIPDAPSVMVNSRRWSPHHLRFTQ
jgi:deoxycytidylate deaminase